MDTKNNMDKKMEDKNPGIMKDKISITLVSDLHREFYEDTSTLFKFF